MFSKLSDRFADIPDWSEARCNLLAKSSLQATCRFYYIIFYYFINICNLYMTSCEMKCCKSYKRIATCSVYCSSFQKKSKQTGRRVVRKKTPSPWQNENFHYDKNQCHMPETKDPWKFHVIFFITTGNSTSFLLTPGISTLYFINTPVCWKFHVLNCNPLFGIFLE